MAYLPPATAHTPPAWSPASEPPLPAAAPVTPPPAAPVAQPGRPSTAPVPPPAPGRVVAPAPRPSAPIAVQPTQNPPHKKHPPQKKKKLREKDIWVEQVHPESAPRMEPPPRRLVSKR